eukprot:NODE_54_length_30443_cov_1.442954.p21 type:complete len:131 gc:universal NODE_54_length_30443_cov_1.442954:20762-20370(-)
MSMSLGPSGTSNISWPSILAFPDTFFGTRVARSVCRSPNDLFILPMTSSKKASVSFGSLDCGVERYADGVDFIEPLEFKDSLLCDRLLFCFKPPKDRVFLGEEMASIGLAGFSTLLNPNLLLSLRMALAI